MQVQVRAIFWSPLMRFMGTLIVPKVPLNSQSAPETAPFSVEIKTEAIGVFPSQTPRFRSFLTGGPIQVTSTFAQVCSGISPARPCPTSWNSFFTIPPHAGSASQLPAERVWCNLWLLSEKGYLASPVVLSFQSLPQYVQWPFRVLV